MVYVNQHRVRPRCGVPRSRRRITSGGFAREGIRTIVNLRGERLCGSFWLEEQACARHGIALVNFSVRSRGAFAQGTGGARELFERIEYPMLMHCVGRRPRRLMSVLYRHFKEGIPIAQAKRELSLRYGHIRQADTGILDYFFERYLGMPPRPDRVRRLDRDGVRPRGTAPHLPREPLGEPPRRHGLRRE